MKQKVLIVGAGVAGKELLKEISKHKELAISPQGFIDDDRKKTVCEKAEEHFRRC